MIGKIDKYGFLWIERMRPEGATFEKAECPYGKNVCGDACALFGEPVKLQDDTTGIACTELEVCVSLLDFDTFADERGAK